MPEFAGFHRRLMSLQSRFLQAPKLVETRMNDLNCGRRSIVDEQMMYSNEFSDYLFGLLRKIFSFDRVYWPNPGQSVFCRGKISLGEADNDVCLDHWSISSVIRAPLISSS